MKFFGMVAMLALVSTVAFADDHASSHGAADAASAAGSKMQEAGTKAEDAGKMGSKKMEKAARKAHVKADKAGAELKEAAKKEGEKADAAH